MDKDQLIIDKFPDYFKYFKELNNKKEKFPDYKKVSISILSSFTISQIKPILFVENMKNRIFTEIYIPDFNQFRQEIINKNSNLHKFKPDVIFLFLRIEDIWKDFFLLNEEKRSVLKKEIIDSLVNLIEKGMDGLNSTFFINDFFFPYQIPNKYFNFQDINSSYNILKEINMEVKNKLGKFLNVYFYDIEYLIREIGKEKAFDLKMDYYASMPFTLNFLVEVGNLFARLIKILYYSRKKCIVVDLDNTIWGGIVGEDGIERLKIGGGYPGNVYSEIQKILKYYKENGIILAINSKNNKEDAIEVFKNHSGMVLKLEDFSSIKINWDNKVKNIIDISKELNIGLDSIVFIDDNPVEIERVKKYLPEVETIAFNDSPVENLKKLLSSDFFDSLFLTEEDKKKTEDYYNRKKRIKLRKITFSQEEFVKSLNLYVEIGKIDEFSFRRIYQLIHKTNQFNLSVKRYSETDLKSMMEEKDKIGIYYVKAKDKFGDYGIIGVVCLKLYRDKIIIDTFLLSCRALGLGIENIMLDFIVKMGVEKNVEKILAEYRKTAKNKIVEDFLLDAGFKKKKKWELNLKEEIKKTKILKVINYKYEL